MVTLVFGGAVKRKTEAGCLLKVTVVKPVSNAGERRPLGEDLRPAAARRSWSRSRCATEPMSERVSFGFRTSWYAERPATRAVRSTLTAVVRVDRGERLAGGLLRRQLLHRLLLGNLRRVGRRRPRPEG